MNMQTLVKELAKFRVNTEDAAVAQYIKSQSEYLVSKGEDLSQYELQRVDGGFEITDDGMCLNVYYRLKKEVR